MLTTELSQQENSETFYSSVQLKFKHRRNHLNMEKIKSTELTDLHPKRGHFRTQDD